MKVAVHQPNFMPYLGFFDKIRQVDTFVVLNDVQYTKRGYTNRNKIKKPNGSMWLTVPVSGELLVPINEVLIANQIDWQDHHLKTLEHMYGKADSYDTIQLKVKSEYRKDWEYLADFNIALLELCFEFLGIEVNMVFSSDQNIEADDGSDRILKICSKLGADHYLSGISGRDYLDLSAYKKAGIAVSFHDFNHPIYPQQFGDFIPNLSIIDYLMNVGPSKFWES